MGRCRCKASRPVQATEPFAWGVALATFVHALQRFMLNCRISIHNFVFLGQAAAPEEG